MRQDAVVLRAEQVSSAGHAALDLDAVNVQAVQRHAVAGAAAAEADRQGPSRVGVQEQRQVGEHLLIDNTRGGRAGDRLPIDENAARAVGLLDNGNRGIVTLTVVEQMTRFLYRRLRVDSRWQQPPGQDNRSSSNDTGEGTGEDRRARRQAPGNKPDNKSGENEDAERRPNAKGGDQDEASEEGTGD